MPNEFQQIEAARKQFSLEQQPIQQQLQSIAMKEKPLTDIGLAQREQYRGALQKTQSQLQTQSVQFEQNIARQAPEYAKPEYLEAAYKEALATIKPQIESYEKQIAEKIAHKEELAQGGISSDERRGYEITSNRIAEMQARLAPYKNLLGASKEEVIKKVFSGEVQQVSKYEGDVMGMSFNEGQSRVTQPKVGTVEYSPGVMKILMERAGAGEQAAKVLLGQKVGTVEVSPGVMQTLTIRAGAGEQAAIDILGSGKISGVATEIKRPAGENIIFSRAGEVLGVDSAILGKSFKSYEEYQKELPRAMPLAEKLPTYFGVPTSISATGEYITPTRKIIYKAPEGSIGALASGKAHIVQPTETYIPNFDNQMKTSISGPHIVGTYDLFGVNNIEIDPKTGKPILIVKETKYSVPYSKYREFAKPLGEFGGELFAASGLGLIYEAGRPSGTSQTAKIARGVIMGLKTGVLVATPIAGELVLTVGGAGALLQAIADPLSAIKYTIDEPYEFVWGFVGGGVASGKLRPIIERSPTALKYLEQVEASSLFKTISGYGKNIKQSPIWETIAYEDTALPNLGDYFKIITKSFRDVPVAKSMLKVGQAGPEVPSEVSMGIAEFMTFKTTLSKTLTQQELASQAAQSKLADIQYKLKEAGIDTYTQRTISSDIFSETNRLIQSKLLLDSSIQKQTTGSVVLAAEEGFIETFKKQFGERKTIEEGGGFVGDIEQALRGYSPELKKVGLVAEETTTSLKAKVQLGGVENVYSKLKQKQILADEKAFLDKGLNIGLDIEMLKEVYGMSDIQAKLLEISGILDLPVKGSTIAKLRKIQSYQEDLILKEGYKPGTIRLYQGTTAESAMKILDEGLKPATESGKSRGITESLSEVYLTADINAAKGYANRAALKDRLIGKKSEPTIIEVELTLEEFQSALQKQGGKLGRLGEIKLGAIPKEKIRIFNEFEKRFYLEERKRGIITKEQQAKLLESNKEKKLFEGSDVDVKADINNVDKSIKKAIPLIEEALPGELTSVQQQKIKYSGIGKTELGELTDYTGKGGTEAKPPIGTLVEVPTGKVYQIGEGVTFKIKELLEKDKFITPEQYAENLAKAGDLKLSETKQLEGGASGQFRIVQGEGMYTFLKSLLKEEPYKEFMKTKTPEIIIQKGLGDLKQDVIAHELVHYKTPNIFFDVENLLRIPEEFMPSEILAYALEKSLAKKGFKNPEYVPAVEEIRNLPQTKGGKVDIKGARFFMESMEESGLDIFAELNPKFIKRYKETAGEERTYITTEGKKIKVVKQIFQEFENIDRVANALTHEQVEGGKHVIQSIQEGRYDVDSLFKVKAKGAEAYSAEKALQLLKEEKLLTLTKEGERYVLSKKPEVIPKGTEAADVVLKKSAEFYDKKVFPEIQSGKTEFATFEGKKVAIQSWLGARTSKSLAASVRDKYFGQFGKDIKDVVVGRILDIERLQKGIEQVKDVGAKQRFQAELNKAIDLVLESEGRKPISSEADLTLRYIKSRFSFAKAEKAQTYKPLTEAEFLEAQKLKINLKEKQYSQEQLKNVFSNTLDREVSVAEYPSLAKKAFSNIEKEFGKKQFLKQQKAQALVSKTLGELQYDILSGKKNAANILQKQIEGGAYLRAAKAQKKPYGYLYAKADVYGYGYVPYQKYSKYQKYGEYYETYEPYAKAYTKYGKYSEPYIKTPKYTPQNYLEPVITPYGQYTPTDVPYIPYTPPYTPPPTPLYTPPIPPPTYNYLGIKIRKERKKRQFQLKQLYALQLKRKGKFATVRTGLLRGEALMAGSDISTKELARTFRIVKTGGTRETFGFNEEAFMPSEKIFRGYKVRTGKKIFTPDQFIQLTSANLQSSEEKSQIKEARRLKKLIGY